MSDGWVTIAEAARSIGRHRQQLAKLVADERLPKGFVDRSGGRTRVRLDGLAAAVSDAVRPRADSRFLQQPTTPAEVQARVAATPDSELPDIAESRQRNEHLKGELLELELQAKRGDLLPRARVEKEAFDTGRAIRDGLMQLSSRLAGELAAETNATKVAVLLDAAVREVLAVLHEQLTIQVFDTREPADG